MLFDLRAIASSLAWCLQLIKQSNLTKVFKIAPWLPVALSIGVKCQGLTTLSATWRYIMMKADFPASPDSTRWVTLRKSFSLSDPQFHHWQNEGHNGILVSCLWKLVTCKPLGAPDHLLSVNFPSHCLSQHTPLVLPMLLALRTSVLPTSGECQMAFFYSTPQGLTMSTGSSLWKFSSVLSTSPTIPHTLLDNCK